MKIKILLTTALMAAMLTACSTSNNTPHITLDEFYKRGLNGSLGYPMGTVLEIEAEIIDGDSLMTKGDQGRFLLNILSINGSRLKQSMLMNYYDKNGQLPSGAFELYKKKYGQKIGGLYDEEIEMLKKDYVGSKVTLTVYETGSFQGIPENMPEDCPTWQDHNFVFCSYMVVLKRRK